MLSVVPAADVRDAVRETVSYRQSNNLTQTPRNNTLANPTPINAWSPQPEVLTKPSSTGAYSSAYAYGTCSNNFPGPPKKKVDTLAEAWGIPEPEPFEEISGAGGGSGRQDDDTLASSIYNGKMTSPRTKDESPRQSKSRARPRRGGVPPPQPIFIPEASDSLNSQTSFPLDNFSDLPKWIRPLMSLVQLTRKMRDTQNVLVGAEYETPPSPSTPAGAPTNEGRPTHKSQNSFLNRLGVKSHQSAPLPSQYEKPEAYILNNNQKMDKALPAPPRGERKPYAPENTRRTGSQQDGAQLRRKTSLIKKVWKVVRGK
ncbi:hypothetical protein EST38_g4912 [Candolleomyces aberdarensis]|uniref:Uncharacterized protein n=1 Tax=Candolleomyces aberdarensis TaxID=2316362 RepID=A0A4Q2DP48_9AGAR|nr:hypothetical protein EST38_g4912 [Candolleomyces aberdarensis]